MYARIERPRDLESLTDADLVRELKLGNEAALDVLLGRHSDALYRFCCHLMPNREDAEDICQEAMARVLTRVGSLQSNAAFRGWLFSIARNLAMDWYRSKKRTCAMPDDESLPLPLYSETPHDRVEAREEHQTVAEALSKLAQSHQRVLLLREVKGLSYASIAEEMNVSQSAVETLLFRARRRLREEYSRTAAPAVAALAELRDLLAKFAPLAGGPTLLKVAITGALVGGTLATTGSVAPTRSTALSHAPRAPHRVTHAAPVVFAHVVPAPVARPRTLNSQRIRRVTAPVRPVQPAPLAHRVHVVIRRHSVTHHHRVLWTHIPAPPAPPAPPRTRTKQTHRSVSASIPAPPPPPPGGGTAQAPAAPAAPPAVSAPAPPVSAPAPPASVPISSVAAPPAGVNESAPQPDTQYPAAPAAPPANAVNAPSVPAAPGGSEGTYEGTGRGNGRAAPVTPPAASQPDIAPPVQTAPGAAGQLPGRGNGRKADTPAPDSATPLVVTPPSQQPAVPAPGSTGVTGTTAPAQPVAPSSSSREDGNGNGHANGDAGTNASAVTGGDAAGPGNGKGHGR